MNNNGNEIFKEEELSKLNGTLKENEKIKLPEKLSAKSIEELVSGVSQCDAEKAPEQQAKKSKKLALRVLAGAAAFAVAFTSLAILKPWQKPVKPVLTVGEQLNSKNADDYGEIEKLFCGYAANYKKYNSSLLRGFDFGLFNGVKSFDSALTEAASGDSLSNNTQKEFGKTNEQVEGVSEADVLKNDGKYLYAVNPDFYGYGETYKISGEKVENLAKVRCSVSIIKAGENGKLDVLSKASADFSGDKDVLYASVSEFYVDGDRLYMLVDIEEKGEEAENADGGEVHFSSDIEICRLRNTKSRTAAICFDISNKSSPKELWRVFQEGAYISSRMTEGKLLVISDRYVNISASEETIKDDCIPKATGSDGTYGKINAGDISVMEKVCDASYAIVSLTDLNKGEKSFKVKAVLGGGNDVYCTKNTLYVTNSVWEGGDIEPYSLVNDVFGVSSADASCTQIYKFDISDSIEYIGSTAVKGTALNQFSIDEYNGYLRIATTTGNWGDSLENYVTVIDGDLKTVGFIDKIAKGETIKSVRFMGDTAYVVTFEQTDPLFVIDLKDPASPVIKGELKIPGFSSYLHPVGDGLLLGIGVNGDENGSTGGLKLSLFDVTNPEEPKEVSKYVLEENEKSYKDGSYSSTYISSNAFYDHKALCFDEKTGTVYVTYSKFARFYNPNSDYDSFNNTSGALSVKVNVKEKTLEFLKSFEESTDDGSIYIGRVTYIGNTVYTFDKEGGILFSYDKNSAERLFECELKSN